MTKYHVIFLFKKMKQTAKDLLDQGEAIPNSQTLANLIMEQYKGTQEVSTEELIQEWDEYIRKMKCLLPNEKGLPDSFHKLTNSQQLLIYEIQNGGNQLQKIQKELEEKIIQSHKQLEEKCENLRKLQIEAENKIKEANRNLHETEQDLYEFKDLLLVHHLNKK